MLTGGNSEDKTEAPTSLSTPHHGHGYLDFHPNIHASPVKRLPLPVSAVTGWPDISILSHGESARFTCSFRLIVAGRDTGQNTPVSEYMIRLNCSGAFSGQVTTTTITTHTHTHTGARAGTHITQSREREIKRQG